MSYDRVLTYEGCFGFYQNVNTTEDRHDSHMLRATFATLSVLILGWVMGGHVTCSL